MRNAHSSKVSRSRRIKRRLLAKALIHGAHLCLFLFTPTDVVAESSDSRPVFATGADSKIYSGRQIGNSRILTQEMRQCCTY